MPWLFLELLFSMLCILCADKGSFINLGIMISCDNVVIMVVLMSIYVYVYVCMTLFGKIIRDHACGGMISYVGKCHDKVLGFMRNRVGKVALTYL